MTTTSRRCGVLGKPIEHSLSPVIHRAAYAHLGLDWRYDAFEVDEAGLGPFVRELGPEWRGLSLTMPLKRVALDVADVVLGLAQFVGVANTLVRDDSTGRWRATNTDVSGTVAALAERGVTEVPEACVWGSGATTVSVLAALNELGAGRVHVHARSAERAYRSLARVFDWALAVELVGWEVTPACSGALVTAATTPSGVMDALADRLAAGASGRVLFDVVYDPWPTALAERWLVAGGVVTSGLDLLIHQAADQVRLMTGDVAGQAGVPVGVLRGAAEAELAIRSAT